MAAMGGAVARRYARALFGIGVDSGKFEALGQEIGELATLWSSSPELRQALENPVFRPSEKRAVLERSCPAWRRRPRFSGSRCCCWSGAASCCCRRSPAPTATSPTPTPGGVRARVTSAEPLAPPALERVRLSLEERTGKKVIVETAVDPTLIGGVVAQVGDMVLDGSVRTQLADSRRSCSIGTSGRKHGNPRRRNQPDHPQADRGLRPEGRGHGDRHRADGGRRHRARLRPRRRHGRRAARVPRGGVVGHGAEPRRGQRRRRAPRQTTRRPRGRHRQAHRQASPQVPVGEALARPRGQRARPADRRQGPDHRQGDAARSRSRRPASSRASRCTSRCRPASRPSTR